MKLVAEWREVVDKQHKDLSEKHAADLAKCKEQWDQEKQAEIATKVAEIVSVGTVLFSFESWGSHYLHLCFCFVEVVISK